MIFLSASRVRSKKMLLAHSIFISKVAKLQFISAGITKYTCALETFTDKSSGSNFVSI